jgi:hypothetical protein
LVLVLFLLGAVFAPHDIQDARAGRQRDRDGQRASAANDGEGSDIVKMGSDVTVGEGQVVKDAVAIGDSVTVLSGARVAGNAVAIGGDVVLKANARVDGDAVSIGGELLKEEGASVGGNEVAIFSGAAGVLPHFWKWTLGGVLYRAYLAGFALHFLLVVIMAVLGILLVLFLPEPLQTIAATIREAALKSGGWGVASLVASFLLIVITLGSFLGLLLVPMLMVAIAVVGALGCVGTGVFVGERTVSVSGGSAMRTFLLGMLILGAIGLVPVVGTLVLLVANIFGFGAVLVSRFGSVAPAALR